MTIRKGLHDLAPSGAIAVIAPHPDDETLGCGGLLALAAAEGRSAVVILLTDGGASHPRSKAWPPEALARRREEETRAALAVLGLGPHDLVAFGLPDGALEAVEVAPVIARLTELLRSRAVGAVFVTGPDDPHPDHRQAYAIARAAARAVGAALWTYPVRAQAAPAGPLDHVANLPIGAVVDVKARALSRHASQWPGGVPDDPEGFHLTTDDLAFHLNGEERFAAADPG